MSRSIVAFKPNVVFDEALHAFSNRGIGRRFVLSTPLRSVAELYIPFSLFQATIKHGNTHDIRSLAMDRFCGALDPFIFEHIPLPSELESKVSRNVLDVAITRPQAEAALNARLQRMLFQQGFFRLARLEIRLEFVSDFCMPYWLGLYGSGNRATLKILDATRRVYEGNKLRAQVSQWLRQ